MLFYLFYFIIVFYGVNDMKVQRFDKYTNEEKKALLKHLWDFYGEKEYSSSDLEKYNELVEKNPDKLFEFAVFMFMSELNFQTIVLNCLNDDFISMLLAMLPKIDDGSNFSVQYDKIALSMLSEVVNTYNNLENIKLECISNNNSVKRLILDRNNKFKI